MVGHIPLEDVIGVRAPDRQPLLLSVVRAFGCDMINRRKALTSETGNI